MDSNRLNNKLYRAFDIWKKQDDNCAIRYRCYEIVGENKYCVQSGDYFRLPIEQNQIDVLEKQYIELFIECPPEERDGLYSTIEEAIDMHEKDFISE